MGRGSGQDTHEPLLGFTFRLEVDGKVKAAGYFTECSGIVSENDVVEHKVTIEGKEIVQMIPGRLKWGPVTFKRGVTVDMSFWEWRALVEQGKMADARAAVSVVMLDRDYSDVARWELTRAWPSKISGPTFKSDGNELGIEEVTLVHEGMKRTDRKSVV